MPWVSASLLKSINKKNKLYYSYKVSGRESSRKRYVDYKNTLTSVLRAAKKTYYFAQFQATSNDIKGTWKVIRNVFKSKKKNSDVKNIEIDGRLVEDKNIIVEKFNDYFCSIGPNLSRAVPSCQKSFNDFLKESNKKSLFLFPLVREELLTIVNSLKAGKSPGYDGVNNDIIKQVILAIIQPLIHVFNSSMLNGIVPENMKIAKVVPVFKKGDPQSFSNYRPISLLTSFSKILEKVIYVRTLEFFNKSKIFSNFQFGFREKHTTSHALLHFIDKISQAIDKKMHTIGIFLDYSKAFDTIDHEILLGKLSHYGVRGTALDWFKSYLADRKQFVSLNGFDSGLQNVTCGVPQGSLLGPLLFIVYINDFHFSSDILSFILFADDSSLYYSHKNSQTLLETVNFELSKVTLWIQANKLSLNLQKTNYMFFSYTIKVLPGDVSFNNVLIDRVSSTKFLGLHIDEQMSWKIHVNHLYKTLSRNSGVIHKLKSILPKGILLLMYSTLILPYLNYGVLAWGNSLKTNLEKLYLIQKRVLRIICNVSFRTHTNPLFYTHRILKVQDIYHLQLGSLMYNFDSGVLPQALVSIFKKNSQVHDHATRNASAFHLPQVRTKLTFNTLVFTGPKFWNSLGSSVKQSVSLSSFKCTLKVYLLDKYCDS